MVLVLVLVGVESGRELMVAGNVGLPTGSTKLSVPCLMTATAETFSPKLAFGCFCCWFWVGEGVWRGSGRVVMVDGSDDHDGGGVGAELFGAGHVEIPTGSAKLSEPWLC